MFDNIENHRFGRLIAVCRDGQKWLCRCDCGNEKLVFPSNLKRGLTKSCGCLSRQLSAQRNRIEKKTHGRTFTPEYRAWSGMHQRCCNPKDKSFSRYGARGISVDWHWSAFENFLADMGQRPSALHSLDRIDVNGNYCPENCRWAVQVEQQRNKRSNLTISAFGRAGPLSSFIPDVHSAAYQRARKAILRGDDHEKALASCR